MNKAVLVLLFVFVALVGISASAATGATVAPTPEATPTTGLRTAVPTWTLAFSLDTPTPRPQAVSHLAGTAAATRLAPTRAAPTAIPPTAVPPTATPYVPPRLVIPKLEVDQAIVPVLIVGDTWDLDTLDEQVGWLTTTGAEPEDDLAMALAGHVNVSLGRPGAFHNLKKLKTGDQVIYRSDGLDYIYTVQTQEKVKPDAVDELYVADGTRLLLVTCSDWSYFWSHYAQRLIVTADLVKTEPSP